MNLVPSPVQAKIVAAALILFCKRSISNDSIDTKKNRATWSNSRYNLAGRKIWGTKTPITNIHV